MRKLLLLGVAAAGLAFATSSQAAVLSYQILDGNSVIGSGTNPTGGTLSLAGSDGTFSVSGGSSAYPFLTSPNFSTNNFNMVSSGAGGTLTIKVTETGLTSYSGNIQNTFTLNSLTAPGFSSGTITNYFDASNAAYGTATTLGSVSYTGSGSFSNQNGTSVSMVTPFSETTIYTLTFAANGQSSSLSSSSQLIATPEPASLALVGAGLAAVGFIRRRRSAV